jgi:predicted small secreted protein
VAPDGAVTSQAGTVPVAAELLAHIRPTGRIRHFPETAMTRARPLAAFAAIALLALGLAACDNTVRGAGKDINQTADAVADTVD